MDTRRTLSDRFADETGKNVQEPRDLRDKLPVHANAMKASIDFDPLGTFDVDKPRVLLFEPQELGSAYPQPTSFGLARNLCESPFYFLDRQFQNQYTLPVDAGPTRAGGDPATRAFCKAMLEVLAVKRGGAYLFDAARGEYDIVYAWHATATKSDLEAAFEDSGFEVVSLEFLDQFDEPR
jgi:hypothetical protein